jgi:hypothetical protein
VRKRVPLAELLGPEELAALGASPSPRDLRARLPRGWVPCDDGQHAERDLRLFFREGWMLVVCLLVFGSLGAMFLAGALPRGWAGVARFALLVGLLALAAGVVGPLVTRALTRRAPPT